MDANRRNLLKDRSWMNYSSASDRRKPEYENGVNTFLDFAFSNAGSNEKIRCPCVNCYLGNFHDRKIVFYHLLARGIAKDYNPWTLHGEDETEDEPISSETPVAIAHKEHVPSPRVENNVRSSRQETFNSGVKENRAFHLESDEDRSSPIIPPNVWNYVNAIGMSKPDTGGAVHQGDNSDDDDNGDPDVSIDTGGAVHQGDNSDDDDNGDPDVSIGEDNNFAGLDNCDSSPIQSCDEVDADFVPTEIEQVVADGYSSEAAETQNESMLHNLYNNNITPNPQCLRGSRLKQGDGNPSDERRRSLRGLKGKKELEKSSERVKVELPAKVGRVVGPNALRFVHEASRLLKEMLPVNVIKWKDINPNDVAKLLKKVKNRFIFPNESHVDTALLWQFKQWYRNWRSDLRRSYFNKYDTYDEQLAHRPHNLKEEHWKWLVDYWNSEKFKNISAINTRIRNNAKGFPCVGPTSIARLAYDLEMNKSNQDSDQMPNYLKLYEKQRRRSDKTWISKEAEEGYNKLVKLHQKQVEEHGVDNLSPSEAYAKTFTKAKSINLLGLGGENPIALEGSSFRRRRRGLSDKRIIDASVRARRLENEPAQKSDDDEEEEEEEEERTGGGHCDRQLFSKMREQIHQDTGGGVHQGEDYDDDDNGDPDVSICEDNNFADVDNCDSSPIQSCNDADIVATEAADGYCSEAAQAQNSGNGKNESRRRPRGLKWKRKLEKSSERVKVELPAKVGRVVGPNALRFVQEASWLLKQTLPVNVVKWRDINPNDVANLLEKVKNRFIFPNESHVDTALLWQFKQWFRNWRSDLKKSYFNKYDTYDEQLAHPPHYLKKEHWKWLVDYWNSEKFKNISTINSRIRNNAKGFPCVGPTSIARLAYELEMNKSNQDDSDQTPVYLKLYEKQMRRSDKTWISEEAEEGYNKLAELHRKQVEEHGVDDLSPSEAYAKTFTKAKSINLLGLAENPVALESSSNKRRRTGYNDQKIIDASVRATQVKLESAQKSSCSNKRKIESCVRGRRLKSESAQKSSCSDKRIIETCVRGRRLDFESAQKSHNDVEEEGKRSGEVHSDRQLRSKMREQIRLIRQGLASSSPNKA